MERDYDDAEIYHYKTNFNSHAHVERDVRYHPQRPLSPISTHTLTWSVTRQEQPCNTHQEISTHTLTWSVTETAIIKGDGSGISTHTLTWSVTSESPSSCIYSLISTHTLTWSVTNCLAVTKMKTRDFNSHAHVERDIKNSSIIRWLLISTHTLTWSVTTTMQKIVEKLEISTHTLTWSVTLDVVYIWCLLNVMRTYFFI